MPRRSFSCIRSGTVGVRLAGMTLVSVAITSCAVDEPTASRVNPRVSLAKAPPPAVTVTSTDPTYGFQGDSVLTVHVKGSGFSAGAHSSWQINGDTTHVHEISTAYVSSTEVISTIKVDVDAPPVAYDVVVTLVNGKKGVGAELFTVKPGSQRPQPPISIAVTLDDAGPAGPSRIRSDGLGEYQDGVDGMFAVIDDVGNLQITPLNGQSTTPAARSIALDFSAPADPLNTYRPDVSGQTNFKILTIHYENPRLQDLAVNQTGCYRITFAFRNVPMHHEAHFSAGYDPQASYALVTRTSASMWTIAPNAACGAHPTWALVRSQDLLRKNAPLVSRGNYSLPFSIRIRTL